LVVIYNYTNDAWMHECQAVHYVGVVFCHTSFVFTTVIILTCSPCDSCSETRWPYR